MTPARRTFFSVTLALTLALAGSGAVRGGAAHADGADAKAAAERCAVRVSIALTGNGPDAALLAEAAPQTQVDALLATPAFVDRFARFANAAFDDEPGANAAEDAAYLMVAYALEHDLPWKDVFAGGYDVQAAAGGAAQIVPSAAGLGYFRTTAWMKRYAGNELAGYRLATAYRIMNNMIGLELVASTNAPGADVSATGRQAEPCRGCHYDGPFALDKVARVFSHRVGLGVQMTFKPPTDGPQQVLETTVKNDADVVGALAASEAFRFRACRLAFEFLYGRAENACEGPTFDACMTAFDAKGTIRAAIATVAKDPAFCQ